MKTIELPRSILDEITVHARNEAPRECCGILGGAGNTARTQYPLKNEAAHPDKEYFASPQELFRTMRTMRDAGEEMVAIYHSHPNGSAQPSQADLDLAFYRTIYLIVAVNDTIDVRAFELTQAGATETKIVIS